MKKPKPIRSTSKLTREIFEIGCLKPSSYHKEEISHVNQREEDLRQSNAIRRSKYAGTWNLSKPDNQADLVKFFEIFNDLYFNGHVTGYVSGGFLLGLHLKLDGEGSIADDIHRWGAQLPISTELARVGLDIEEVLARLHKVRVEHEKAEEDTLK
ncbi:hypothetical protein B7494_g2559 [Chlorociboria aeruginascens]|nr:hypothetical protein B7494_g2559 [Chlorociboria aeruginascens]